MDAVRRAQLRRFPLRSVEPQLEVGTIARRSCRSRYHRASDRLTRNGEREGYAAGLAGRAASLRDRDRRRPLVLSVAPVFASKWLIPRLDGFQTAHPEIDVRISATLDRTNFARDGVDAAIRVGCGRDPGLAAHRLFGETVVPMCSPKLATRQRPLRREQDLRHHVLLHFDWPGAEQVAPDWATWLRATQVEGVNARRGPRFTQPDHAMQAAIDGAGIVLGWRTLAAADLAARRLVIPFARPLPMEVAFYLEHPEANVERAELAAFRT